MNCYKRPVISILLAFTVWLTSAAHGENFPGLRALMSEEEYRAAGLDKLSPGELQALERWLSLHASVGPAVEAGSNARESSAAETEPAESDEIRRSRVIPSFNGWSGNTVFRLDNGEVWQQRLKGRFDYSGTENEVEISRNFMGFYWMTHIASGRSVGVKRIE